MECKLLLLHHLRALSPQAVSEGWILHLLLDNVVALCNKAVRVNELRNRILIIAFLGQLLQVEQFPLLEEVHSLLLLLHLIWHS